MNVLITGGAGYIGSHTVLALLKAGHTPIILDDLSGGTDTPPWLERVYVSDFAQKDVLNQIHDSHKIDGVIHFAGKIQVGESMKNPDLYYHHNVAKTMVLLDWMVERNIRRFVFSSSAAVYGDHCTDGQPIPETAAMRPTSPYGRSKAAIETLVLGSKDLDPVCLRYFNASGADAELRTGENHFPEPPLIPLAIQATINNSVFNVFGHSLKSTPDGSCVRDFVHVTDLADAHVKALEMPFDGRSKSFNLGSGTGYSVFQVLDQIEKEHGSGPRISLKPSRPGDPPFLVADQLRARVELGWEPKFSDLKTIIKTAYSWEQKKIQDRASVLASEQS